MVRWYSRSGELADGTTLGTGAGGLGEIDLPTHGHLRYVTVEGIVANQGPVRVACGAGGGDTFFVHLGTTWLRGWSVQTSSESFVWQGDLPLDPEGSNVLTVSIRNDTGAVFNYRIGWVVD